jgi:hypothetical protein
MNVDLTDRTGFVQVGSGERRPDSGHAGSPDYVLPEFSEIVGKLWLARVAWDGCSCDENTAKCGCDATNWRRMPNSSPPG